MSIDFVWTSTNACFQQLFILIMRISSVITIYTRHPNLVRHYGLFFRLFFSNRLRNLIPLFLKFNSHELKPKRRYFWPPCLFANTGPGRQIFCTELDPMMVMKSTYVSYKRTFFKQSANGNDIF